ncbi:hypothetical protein CCUS01_16201 [Colletotrichum cuscutae]|uniref:RING-type domain-containing protein n=1 Tax=Colletotrichum cuscutae TaxID=1209917 RepID=A0AAI9VEQ3_9PEZI|nr:hypothetical protein CCUS01_16201 [Colletotrichum cuscutae]
MAIKVICSTCCRNYQEYGSSDSVVCSKYSHNVKGSQETRVLYSLQCLICHDNCERHLIAIHCGHVFHSECLRDAGPQFVNKCPYCQASVSGKQRRVNPTYTAARKIITADGELQTTSEDIWQLRREEKRRLLRLQLEGVLEQERELRRDYYIWWTQSPQTRSL